MTRSGLMSLTFDFMYPSVSQVFSKCKKKLNLYPEIVEITQDIKTLGQHGRLGYFGRLAVISDRIMYHLLILLCVGGFDFPTRLLCLLPVLVWVSGHWSRISAHACFAFFCVVCVFCHLLVQT